jgi:hypothetical protein
MAKVPRKLNPRRGKSKGKPISRGRFGLSVAAAGKLIGLSKNAAYAAVRAGEIPALKIGGRKIVLKNEWLRKIGASDSA